MKLTYEELEAKVLDMAVQLANAESECRELLDENTQLQRDKDSLEAAAIAMRDDMREAHGKLEAAEKRITDCHTVLNNLAAVARRYLPDYDEHPDIQAADDLLESAAGIGVKGN